jgi:glycosyltransferase involved in cell wall biosynthesis
MRQISHFIGLKGIGGVQRNFIEFLDNMHTNHKQFKHKVYTMGEVDSEYCISANVLDIRKIRNLHLLVKDLISREVIVHFYNNLSSFKVALLLFFIPVRRLVIHERGTAWNQQVKKGFVTRFNAHKASVILSNSKATKVILIKKFLIPEFKITIIHNGININNKCTVNNKLKTDDRVFKLGFIGRLDSPKGVHILLEAMQYLKKYKIKLFIAGDGPLFDTLRRQSTGCSVVFMGRIDDPYDFLKQIDLLVVPSIREPFGNICLEAGLCRAPVLAANIDGLPEIIENYVSGELIDPTDDIEMDLPDGALKLPEFVVNPATHELYRPKQINPKYLARKIFELSSKKDVLSGYSEQLHKRVVGYFSLDRYSSELHKIYKNME